MLCAASTPIDLASTLHENTRFVVLHHYILLRSGLETKLLRVAIPGILAAQRNSGGEPLSFFGWQTVVQHQKQIRLHQSVQKAAAKLPEAIQQFSNEKYNHSFPTQPVPRLQQESVYI